MRLLDFPIPMGRHLFLQYLQRWLYSLVLEFVGYRNSVLHILKLKTIDRDRSTNPLWQISLRD